MRYEQSGTASASKTACGVRVNFSLAQDRFFVHAARLAANGGDDAVTAGKIAALLDLDKSFGVIFVVRYDIFVDTF